MQCFNVSINFGCWWEHLSNVTIKGKCEKVKSSDWANRTSVTIKMWLFAITIHVDRSGVDTFNMHCMYMEMLIVSTLHENYLTFSSHLDVCKIHMSFPFCLLEVKLNTKKGNRREKNLAVHYWFKVTFPLQSLYQGQIFLGPEVIFAMALIFHLLVKSRRKISICGEANWKG